MNYSDALSYVDRVRSLPWAVIRDENPRPCAEMCRGLPFLCIAGRRMFRTVSIAHVSLPSSESNKSSDDWACACETPSFASASNRCFAGACSSEDARIGENTVGTECSHGGSPDFPPAPAMPWRLRTQKPRLRSHHLSHRRRTARPPRTDSRAEVQHTRAIAPRRRHRAVQRGSEDPHLHDQPRWSPAVGAARKDRRERQVRPGHSRSENVDEWGWDSDK